MSFNRKIINCFLSVIILVFFTEGVSYIAIGYLERKGIIYKPYMPKNYGEYLKRRDPMLGCRVSNFGVEGYGTDHSYLRFKYNDRDRAKIVILGHLSENIIRNVNQLKGLLYHSRGVDLHPRFIIGQDGSLEFIPC